MQPCSSHRCRAWQGGHHQGGQAWQAWSTLCSRPAVQEQGRMSMTALCGQAAQ